MCFSVCPWAYLWNRSTDLHKIFVQIPCSHGSVLLWWRCNALCTSGFMDDAMIGHSGLYGDVWLAALQYRGGVWCLWMPCLLCFKCMQCFVSLFFWSSVPVQSIAWKDLSPKWDVKPYTLTCSPVNLYFNLQWCFTVLCGLWPQYGDMPSILQYIQCVSKKTPPTFLAVTWTNIFRF